MRNIYDVLREKQKCVEQVRREVEALRLTAQLVNETENHPANIATPGSDLETHSTPMLVERERSRD
jgi:hypothetical protein